MNGSESRRYTGSDPVDTMRELDNALSRNEIPLEMLTPKQAEAIRRLGELAKLPFNWDTYGSPPPSPTAVDLVIDILVKLEDRNLPSARVVPVSGGGVQLEWHAVPRELQLEISADGTAQYLQIENGRPIIEEEIHALTTDRVRSLVLWLIPRISQRWAA